METVTISREAVHLRELSQQSDVYLMLQLYCPGRQVGLPYRQRMAELPMDEMNLSVRSSNALMRSNAITFGGVMDLMLSENGLKKVRNLGIKSDRLYSFDVNTKRSEALYFEDFLWSLCFVDKNRIYCVNSDAQHKVESTNIIKIDGTGMTILDEG